MEQQCYFCGGMNESREHVPPKQIFRNFPCDKITVPSCFEHNTNKSNQDEAIIKGMIYSLSIGKEKLNPIVQAAIDIALPRFYQVKKLVHSSVLLPEICEIDTRIAYVSPLANIDDWVKKMSVALIYDRIKYYEPENDYSNIYVFNSTYYNSTDNGIPIDTFIKQYNDKKDLINEFECLEWVLGWPSGKTNYPKELYNFHYTLYDEYLFFRHHFYEDFLFYCGIRICETTRLLFLKK